jgi:hypothetical protein
VIEGAVTHPLVGRFVHVMYGSRVGRQGRIADDLGEGRFFVVWFSASDGHPTHHTIHTIHEIEQNQWRLYDTNEQMDAAYAKLQA